MVISVGYRVSSTQATLFRRWATDKLVQFATKGFVIDAEQLKGPEARDRVAELRERPKPRPRALRLLDQIEKHANTYAQENAYAYSYEPGR